MKIQNKTSKQFPFPGVGAGVGALTIAAMFLLISVTNPVQAQDLSSPAKGTLIVPQSSMARPQDAGVRAHTNYEIFVPAGMQQLMNPSGPPSEVETPASLACIYQLVPGPYPAGCKKSNTTTLPTGGSGTIVIVDAYDYPNANSDLQAFSAYYGLPSISVTQIYANGTSTPPPTDPSGGWEGEEALDIEWAHAMAPNAGIVLVEAQSSLYTDLLDAEVVATKLFQQVCTQLFCYQSFGPGEISNSWGGPEFSGEVAYDGYFEPYSFCPFQAHCNSEGMVVFAAAGDNLQVNWPSVSPWVVSAGGTTINRDRFGNFVREGTWYTPPTGGGGGPSNGFEPIPTWQASLNSLLNGWRGTPDISFEANPASGVGVYDTNYPYSGWIPGYVGGTSLASPALAGIVNSAGNFNSYGLVGKGYIPENAMLYSELGGAVTYPTDFTDINQGTPGTNVCGASGQYSVQYGWDFCTGVGTPLTLVGK